MKITSVSFLNAVCYTGGKTAEACYADTLLWQQPAGWKVLQKHTLCDNC